MSTLRARSKARLLSVIAAVAAATLTVATPWAAVAAEGDGDVGHQIELRWKAGTPALTGDPVKTGVPVTAETRINVNSVAGAPDNDAVDNVLITYTLNEYAVFSAIPTICKTDGVTPASSISDDARTLVCNVGTQANGTAVAVDISVVADGITGQSLTLDATVSSDADHGTASAQLEHPITSPFAMDMDWTDSAGQWESTDHLTHRAGFQWTLYVGKGVTEGPATVSYDVTLTPQMWGATGGEITAVACRPYANTAISNAHPWSSEAGAPAEQSAPFSACQVSAPRAQANGTYLVTMTLSGLTYDPSVAPTTASNGDALRTDMYAMTTGELYITQKAQLSDGAVHLDANAPTYSDGVSSFVDDTANNHAEKGWTRPGGWNSWFLRWATGDGGNIQDGSYFVTPGTVVQQQSVMSGPNSDDTDKWALDMVPNPTLGLCTVLDREFLTYTKSHSQTYPIWGTSGTEGPLPGTFRYFIASGADTFMDITKPYDNGGRSIMCTDLQREDRGGRWVTSLDGIDPALVQGVEFLFKRDDARNRTAELIVNSRVKDNVVNGQDVWQVSSWHMGAPWGPNNAGMWLGTGYNDISSVDTSSWNPAARFPSTNTQRDVFRVASALPTIKKSTSTPVIEAQAGTTADFTIEFTAQNLTGSGPDTTDNLALRDVLPAGMTYVAGSAAFPGSSWIDAALVEPQVSTENGRQVLIWPDLDGVPVRDAHTVTYQVTLDADAEGGELFTNTASATLNGRTVDADASVTTGKSGLTLIGKSANQQLMPNDDGTGTGSWTVTLRSLDGEDQTFTDVIDILPYDGDPRGSSFSGDFAVTTVTAEDQTVYYTTQPIADLDDDPSSTINGTAGEPSDIWSTTKPADASAITAIRVIGGTLAYNDSRAFTVEITTNGATGGDVYVNRAQGRTSHTELVMRTVGNAFR